MIMTYEDAKKQKEILEEINKFFSDRLSLFPTIEMGLVSDDVRNSVEYIEIKKEYEKSFINLQVFNSWFVKTFKKEYSAERKNKYNKSI